MSGDLLLDELQSVFVRLFVCLCQKQGNKVEKWPTDDEREAQDNLVYDVKCLLFIDMYD